MTIVVCNWKMFLRHSEAIKLAEEIAKQELGKVKLVILPSYATISAIEKSDKFELGAQNCTTQEEYGAYTGDVSAKDLKEIGCKYVLVGHKETAPRSKWEIRDRGFAACKAGLVPIVCSEDPMELACLPSPHIIAYEPSENIGAKDPMAMEKIAWFVSKLKHMNYNNLPQSILYGGSVTEENVKEIVSIEGLDGVLLGRAGSNKESLFKIIEKLQ